MFYEYDCWGCGDVAERNCAVDERDLQVCMKCMNGLVRRFQPPMIVVPERFGLSMSRLAPTYQELADLDKRNDEWVSRKREPEKASFETCLEQECLKNRVDPNKLQQYTLNQSVKGLL